MTSQNDMNFFGKPQHVIEILTDDPRFSQKEIRIILEYYSVLSAHGLRFSAGQNVWHCKSNAIELMNSLSVLRHLKVNPRFSLGDIAKSKYL